MPSVILFRCFSRIVCLFLLILLGFTQKGYAETTDFETGLEEWVVSSVGNVPGNISTEIAYDGLQSFKVGPSTCGASCFDSYSASLTRNFISPVYIESVSAWLYELGNWGGKGYLKVDGVQADGPLLSVRGNSDPVQPGWVLKEWQINSSVSFIAFYFNDLTSSDPMFIDGILLDINSNIGISLTPIEDQSMDEGAILTVPISAVNLESEGPSPVLSVESLPGFGAFIDNGDGTGSIEFSPIYGDDGDYSISVTAAVGEFVDSDQFILTVHDINRPPVITPIEDVIMGTTETLSILFSAMDPDNDSLTLSIAGQPSFGVFSDYGDGTGVLEISTDENSSGIFPISFTASDGLTTSSECFLLTVSNSNATGSLFIETFESSGGCWDIDNGVWEIGQPTAGPSAAHEGISAVGTVLSGSYHANTDSRLISPEQTLPTATEDERVELRFWTWYSYSSGDNGYVQVSTWDGAEWSSWTNLATRATASSYSNWSREAVDLTFYAGQTVRLAFYHTASNTDYYNPDESHGWFIDEVEIWHGTPVFNNPENFETGWGDWHSDNGVWEIGQPTAGPSAAHEGISAVGTVLSGNY
ncbi:MAG: choice-of-anchor J domain-containing protein, partial [bacterium]